MEACTLPYIPERLHTNNRLVIEDFSIGEFLFRRCKPDHLDNPFASISLVDLSHNRGGSDGMLSLPSDVLFNIRVDEDTEIYQDHEVVALEIISLNQENRYNKYFTQKKDGTEIIARMEILHDPEPCMFPHCIFRIWIGDDLVTYDNYNSTLKKLTEIRNKIREELSSMRVKKVIDQDGVPEDL